MVEGKDRLVRAGLGFALVCWLGAVCVSVRALSPETIPWRTDFQRAEMEARTRGRLLWLQFTGSWCPNCLRMERESFVHPRVVEQACNNFIPVRVQSDQHEDLVDRFALNGIPATILVKPSGEVIARHEGYVDAEAFCGFLERALIQSGQSPRPSHANLTRTSAPGVPALPRDVPARPATATSAKRPRPGSETIRR